MTKEKLLDEIKRAVLEEESSAQVVLYGSRARGDAAPESDWDLLILTDHPVDRQRKQRIRRRLYEIEWDTGQVITSIIHSHEEWNQPPLTITPFRKAVEREGIAV